MNWCCVALLIICHGSYNVADARQQLSTALHLHVTYAMPQLGCLVDPGHNVLLSSW